jgi:uncharacterized protein (DUF2267 family)
MIDYNGFISTVKERAAVASDQEAQLVACATLQTLSERLSAGEAEDIRERLPAELRRCLVPEQHDPRFHADEFLRRIARRAGVDETSAERDAQAVFVALWRAVGPDEFADMRAELPKDFDPLLDSAIAQAPPAEPGAGGTPAVTLDRFLELVESRASLDLEDVRRATEAVLEVLGYRVSGGQVEDIEPYLPAELRPPLEKGRVESGGEAKPLSDDTFVKEIARRGRLSRGQAAEAARAVFATLREILPQKEWADTRAQLPGEYAPLLKEG